MDIRRLSWELVLPELFKVKSNLDHNYSMQLAKRKNCSGTAKFFQKDMLKRIPYSLLILLIAQLSRAQENAQLNSAEETAKKLANPNATIGQFFIPIDYIHYNGDLNGASDQNAFKISLQPSLPYAVKKGQNIFFRPLIPFIVSQPTISEEGAFIQESAELGDIGYDLAYGISYPSKWMTLFGITGTIPSATKADLGSGRWMLGPEVFVGKATGWGFAGVLVTQSWSLNKNKVDNTPDPDDFGYIGEAYYPDSDALSVLSGQYMYTVNLKNAWQIQGQPVYVYNHKAKKGNRLTFPLGTGVSKTIMAGKMPMKFNLQYWYYVARAEAFGPQHQVRFQIIPVVNLPW